MNNRYKGVKRHSGKRNRKSLIVILIIVGVLIIGIFVYQQYANAITNYIQIGKLQDIITNTITKSPETKPTNFAATALDVHNLINEERKAAASQPLSWNPKLAQAALNHSADMAKRNYFTYDNPEGHNYLYRYAQVGFQCNNPTFGASGENIALIPGFPGVDPIANETLSSVILRGLNYNPNVLLSQRSNILAPWFLSEGIGIAESDDGKIYVTEDFC